MAAPCRAPSARPFRRSRPPSCATSASPKRADSTLTITLPADAAIVLIGPSGSGKSRFAAQHFTPTEVLSSDALRAVVSGDETDQSATDDAFRLLHLILDMRLARGRLTVVDATNVERWARRLSVDVARRHRRPAVALVFDLPLEACLEHNAHRADGRRPPAAIRRQHQLMRASGPTLGMEGFDPVVVLSSVEGAAAARVERTPPAGHENVPKEPRPSLQ